MNATIVSCVNTVPYYFNYRTNDTPIAKKNNTIAKYELFYGNVKKVTENNLNDLL